MNKSLLLIGFSLTCYMGNSQTSTDTQPKQTSQSIARTPQQMEEPIVTALIKNENDQYVGLGDYYAHMFITQQIPSDFPKYSKELSLDYYDQLVLSYLRVNSNLLLEKFKNKYSK